VELVVELMVELIQGVGTEAMMDAAMAALAAIAMVSMLLRWDSGFQVDT